MRLCVCVRVRLCFCDIFSQSLKDTFVELQSRVSCLPYLASNVSKAGRRVSEDKFLWVPWALGGSCCLYARCWLFVGVGFLLVVTCVFLQET